MTDTIARFKAACLTLVEEWCRVGPWAGLLRDANYAKFATMKAVATVRIASESRSRLNAVLNFIREMGMEVSVDYGDATVHELSMVSEPALAEAWLSEEDDRWDEFYPDVAGRKG
jgi:hypothetical protein